MANGMYSTPLMGTGIAANPMGFQRNTTLMGTTMPTTPQVSTVMPPPPMQPATQTPQVSTVMPTGTKVKENMRSIISTNPQFFDVILVDEDTPNLKEILTFSTYDSQYGITLYKDPKLNIVYAVDDVLKIYASEIITTRGSGLQNVSRDTTQQDQTIMRPQLYNDIGQPFVVGDRIPIYDNSDQFGINLEPYNVSDSLLLVNSLTQQPMYQSQIFNEAKLDIPKNSFYFSQVSNNQVFQTTEYRRQNMYNRSIPVNTYHTTRSN